MKISLIIAFVFISITTTAQNKLTFSSQNFAGLLEGESGSKFQLQSINGVKYNTWFVGLGTGIDWYFRRSIPAFASLGKDFFGRGNRNFYVSASAGINFPWEGDNKYNEWGYSVEESKPGIYYEAGLGYKVGIGKNNDALLIQLGYSYKHISEKVQNVIYYMSIMPPGSEQYDFANRFDYRLRRLSIKFGWNF